MASAPLTLPAPVGGILHPANWNRPAGNKDWKVTKTAAAHDTTGVKAIDLGDGDADKDPAYAIIAGKIAEFRKGDGVLTIESFDGLVRAVYAHFAIDSLFLSHPLGSLVAVGDLMGHVSNTYPPPTILAAHLHLQVGIRANKSISWKTESVWKDPWILLAINQAAVLNGPGSNLRARAGTDAAVVATSRADGIYQGAKKVAPLDARIDVGQPAFAAANGLVWVNGVLPLSSGAKLPVSVWKNLVHFDL